MEILAGRVLLRPADPDVTTAFYRDRLGLAVYREFPGGTVFHLGGGFLEVSGHASEPADRPRTGVALWMQVRDLAAAHKEIVDAGVTVTREPRREPWGLDEMWIADPDGVVIGIVEIPPEHPLRRDTR
ncbi:VOC family protein [Pseudonocardia sp. WMMC193]|uniref:VOC family protein n=1 Tax=Pseudonocardia sp. WMMC193 TaxID=2911965 RepID=UPI001F447ADA|nr:VOC family protein [Pseudonocardia sp. WMMC193]MCF7553387.1 VOC family protein [Pseudonocardia sp. WMMC193]